ncbi:hypothetical protein IB277_06495 [Ensifer sp. ENS07]|uniref:hypothetical protein n=1 Tax=Ensifer sp. ENS07 TaxID=2769274 RepID=UPI0017863AA3|nr:hypothetical protein [Ensifer sp. ENS07]MBD9635942.1 hypothetical protein [Ensifer sp. ENS07]
MSASKLIVLMAFDENDDGELIPAIEPKQVETEDRAVREARALAARHTGVIAWARDADPAVGEYGPPVELFKHGKIPDLE